MPGIYEAYTDLVKYTQHLENVLIQHTPIDEESVKAIRACYIKPATNVAKEWVEEEK